MNERMDDITLTPDHTSHARPTQVRVRFFAAAKEAAGHAEVDVTLPAAATVADLRAELAGRTADLRRVLAACSLLVDGTVHRDETTPLPPSPLVDVLPPFAGG